MPPSLTELRDRKVPRGDWSGWSRARKQIAQIRAKLNRTTSPEHMLVDEVEQLPKYRPDRVETRFWTSALRFYADRKDPLIREWFRRMGPKLSRYYTCTFDDAGMDRVVFKGPPGTGQKARRKFAEALKHFGLPANLLWSGSDHPSIIELTHGGRIGVMDRTVGVFSPKSKKPVAKFANVKDVLRMRFNQNRLQDSVLLVMAAKKDCAYVKAAGCDGGNPTALTFSCKGPIRAAIDGCAIYDDSVYDLDKRLRIARKRGWERRRGLSLELFHREAFVRGYRQALAERDDAIVGGVEHLEMTITSIYRK